MVFLTQVLTTLAKLSEIPISLVLPGSGGGVSGRAMAVGRKQLAHGLALDRSLKNAFSSNPETRHSLSFTNVFFKSF